MVSTAFKSGTYASLFPLLKLQICFHDNLEILRVIFQKDFPHVLLGIGQRRNRDDFKSKGTRQVLPDEDGIDDVVGPRHNREIAQGGHTK